MGAYVLLCLWREEEQKKLDSSQHHGLPAVDATIRGGGITASLIVFPHRAAKVYCVFL